MLSKIQALKIFILGVLLFFIGSNYTHAQFYSTGQDPASTKWKQINTAQFQVLFQEENRIEAQKIANILDYYYNNVGKTLSYIPSKISVVIHNQTIASNGYVAWAPKRMELFTTPSQNNSLEPWLEHLLIHELRHVVQIGKLNQGITKILSIIFGQQATGLVAGQLPMWYYEGDAVCTETALSKYGRGRLPSFQRAIRTHLLSDETRYSYDKMLFGSYQNFVPNHYELGYQLTAYARSKHNKFIWSDIENHVAKNSYTILPTTLSFYWGLKKFTGLSQEKLYHETFDYLDSSWTSENLNGNFIDPKWVQDYAISEYENYINPVYIDKDHFVALKKGLSHLPQFVWVSENSERVIYEPGILLTNDFSFSNDLLVWSEYMPDMRWANREFNKIKMLNINTGIEITLVNKTRYFSPDISANSEKIVVVEVDEKNQSELVILSAFDGSILEKIASVDGYFLQRPKWSKDGNQIYVIEVTNKGKQISSYNLISKEWDVIFLASNSDIQKIIPVSNKVYFHSTQNGIDNLFVYDQDQGETYQLSSSKNGISEFDISPNESEILVNEYTSQGFRLAKIPIERALWHNVSQTENYRFELADELSDQEDWDTTKQVSNTKEFEVKSFRKPLNLFNFHSWIPAYIDYNNIDYNNILADPSEIYGNIYPGLMLLSQNKLSTTESIIGYGFKNGNHKLSSSITFKGQYPVLKIGASYGIDQYILAPSDVSWHPEVKTGYSYDVDVYVPINLNAGNFIRGLRPRVVLEYYDNFYYNNQQNYFIKGMEYLRSELLFYSYKMKAERDIIPQLGVVFNMKLINTPFENEIFGYLYNFDAIFYIPGGKNKAIKTELGYQFQEPNQYLFNSNFNFPRGILKKRTEKLYKIYTDYIFPIAYPDWNLSSILYLKRLRGDLFIDYAYNSFRKNNSSNSAFVWYPDHNLSFGVELSIDYHLLRMLFPMNTGIRFGYTPTGSNLFTEVIFGLDLNGF